MQGSKFPAVLITPEQQDFIIEGVLHGKTMVSIIKELGIPRRWIALYAAKDPFFKKSLEEARVEEMHDQVESLRTIVDGYNSMEDVNAARLRSENIKWSASKVVPMVYGDRIDLNINHSLDLSAVLLAAENRVMPILQAKAHVIAHDSVVDQTNSIDVVDSTTSDDDISDLI